MKLRQPGLWLKRLPTLLIDTLYPFRCQACGCIGRSSAKQGVPPFEGLSGRYLCPDCMAGLQAAGSPLCSVCGIPFPHAAGGDHVCGACIETAPAYDRARSVGVYAGPLMAVIHRYKYLGKTGLAKPLGQLLFDLFSRLDPDGETDLILPVPLHPRRVHHRGFNQAWLLIRQWDRYHRQRFGRHPAWVLDDRTLIRTRHTHAQVGLNRDTRKRNLKKAFSVRHPDRVAGRRIVLVDDVLTTGTTADTCARVLKQSGAAQVWVLTVARTL